MSYTFDEEALLAQNVFPRGPSVPGLRLTNDVHPLFRQKNFEMNPEWLGKVFKPSEATDNTIARERQYMDDELYKRLRPALQLATLLLDISLEFISRLAFAPKGATNLEVFDDVSDAATARRTQEVRTLLEELADDILIFMNGETHIFGPRTHGLTHAFYRPNFLRFQVHIRLDDGYATHFRSSEYSTVPGTLQDAACFGLAVTLVHEIMHGIWGYRHRFSKQPREPAWLANEPETLRVEEDWGELAPDVEYGWAWERWMFGNNVHELDTGPDWNPKYGFCWISGQPGGMKFLNPILADSEPDVFGIDFKSISRMFLQQTWANGKKPEISLTTERAIIGRIEQHANSDGARAMKVEWSPYNVSLQDIRSLKALLAPAGGLLDHVWASVWPLELVAIQKSFQDQPPPATAEELIAYRDWSEARIKNKQSLPNSMVEAFEAFRQEQRVQ